MIDTVVDLLRCPRCHAAFAPVDRSLRCPDGHTYDIAKQGYVNLTGAAQPAHADTSAMITARSELLGSGRYAAVAEAVVQAASPGLRTVLDVGTGTGHYAAALLGARPAARAVGLDISVAACRRAARAHPRLGVATADAWLRLPVGDHGFDVIISVFSPRHPTEFARVLRPDGMVITVTPGPDHLHELRTALDLLGVEAGKQDRLAEGFARAGLTMLDQQLVERREPWTSVDAVRSVLMGPNAFHHGPEEIEASVAALDWPQAVTISCQVACWNLRSNGS